VKDGLDFRLLDGLTGKKKRRSRLCALGLGTEFFLTTAESRKQEGWAEYPGESTIKKMAHPHNCGGWPVFVGGFSLRGYKVLT